VREGAPAFVRDAVALPLELIFLFDAEIVLPSSFGAFDLYISPLSCNEPDYFSSYILWRARAEQGACLVAGAIFMRTYSPLFAFTGAYTPPY
jgi:hypothetical protein